MTEVTTAAQCVHRLWRLYKTHTRDSTRRLAQTGKPHVVKGILTLLDGTKFLLEIDVKRGSSHFFLDDYEQCIKPQRRHCTHQRHLVVLESLEPLVDSFGYRDD